MPAYFLNTRPFERAKSLTLACEASNIAVQNLPLLALTPVALSTESNTYLKNIETYDCVIVISPTASELGLHALKQTNPTIDLNHLNWIAVGQSTAQSLEQSGVKHTRAPQIQTSEGLLAMPELLNLTQCQRVLIWRGLEGRDLIENTLKSRDIFTDAIPFYARALPEHAKTQWQTIFNTQGLPQAVLISSGESWSQWQQLAGEHATLPSLIVMGERVKNIIQQQLNQPNYAHLPKPTIQIIDDLQPETIVDLLENNTLFK